MKKTVVLLLVFVLSLGILGACDPVGVGNNNNNANSSNNNTSSQQENRTPADTVLLFAKLYSERDINALSDILYRAEETSFDPQGYTFVSLSINVQNPDAQMEPFEIEYYQDRFDDLLDTAIVCAEATYVFKFNETNEETKSVYYYDYYLISTKSHPEWRIMTWANQAGY